MIVVQERLTEVFKQLPTIDGFTPKYRWGNASHLQSLLKRFSEEKQSPYPLVYQTSIKSKQDTAAHNCEVNLVLVIACQNKETDLLNENRWAMSYENILYPMVENIRKCFERAGIFNWDGVFSISEFPNYGNASEDANHTIDIWDAVQFETTITIEEKASGEPKCINKNIFKNGR